MIWCDIWIQWRHATLIVCDTLRIACWTHWTLDAFGRQDALHLFRVFKDQRLQPSSSTYEVLWIAVDRSGSKWTPPRYSGHKPVTQVIQIQDAVRCRKSFNSIRHVQHMPWMLSELHAPGYPWEAVAKGVQRSWPCSLQALDLQQTEVPRCHGAGFNR